VRHDSWGTRFSRRRKSSQNAGALDGVAKRALDLVGAIVLMVLLTPLVLVLAIAIKLDSRGPVFYRCRRIGRGGEELLMLKFRKMHDGARGPALAAARDERFTRMGAFLSRTKLDELPQLWNVLRGQMSLVGPRPEDPGFVELHRAAYDAILAVRPGITGLSQLAFAKESEILDPSNRVNHYLDAILPQKILIDLLYARRRSLGIDLQILGWTFAAVVFRRDVAVHRQTGGLSRRRPRSAVCSVAVEQTQAT
jgi:lipopolysaccharide/colanic/teichoic acid biosynthesis glycosyltransferase